MRMVRDIGLALVVVVAASFVQLAGQGGGTPRRFIAVDLVGNFSPGIPPGSQWPMQTPPFAVAFDLARGANGNILFSGTPGYSVAFGEIVSVPNNTSGQSGF